MPVLSNVLSANCTIWKTRKKERLCVVREGFIITRYFASRPDAKDTFLLCVCVCVDPGYAPTSFLLHSEICNKT